MFAYLSRLTATMNTLSQVNSHRSTYISRVVLLTTKILSACQILEISVPDRKVTTFLLACVGVEFLLTHAFAQAICNPF